MKKWSAVAVLALAQFVMVLDSTVMNVSISTIVKDLHTTVSSLQACITFYTLTMAALMLIGAKLCSKWGLMRAFSIGAIVYGIGSLITGLSPTIQVLFVGWSVIEGLGAVLVIPAIAALIAVMYSGKDRVTAFAIIGGISGAAAAAGPLIGGFMTTYLSWRYVFIAETIIMIIVLLVSRSFKVETKAKSEPIDINSALLSAFGMTALVLGMLQSKTWGWIKPLSKPQIAGHAIAPLGFSVVIYLIIIGILVLKYFFDRQRTFIDQKKIPFLDTRLFSIKRLRSGLSVLMSQYLVTAAAFFVIPVYLQMVLGLDALKTGIKILPLSIALILFSILGSRIVNRYSPRTIVRIGQALLIFGASFLYASINPSLTGIIFAGSMFALGAGLGLLASQLGNINMSAVDASRSSEIGGLQGTFQNLGSSLGTAVIGSVLVLSLTSGFVSNINSSNLPDNIKQFITTNSSSGVGIVPSTEVYNYALSKGVSDADANQIASTYKDSQISGLKDSIFFLGIIAVFSIMFSRGIPKQKFKT